MTEPISYKVFLNRYHFNELEEGSNQDIQSIRQRPARRGVGEAQKKSLPDDYNLERLADIQSLINREQTKKTTVSEGISAFSNELRRLYYSGKRYSFKEWLDIIEDLIDKIA